ncbi:NAD(P)H-binding protein [Geomonas sp. Red32]|uniref:NmrA family NAD(P)-binding protein n=1 Tax=Geomonas sp. Red32 TaxID=2912856 RepID=UPI00202CBB38|nr:NmrA family NAD(P)-binding protein [Geomonas sp. Red32]MCM0083836.1 NAD(P)H-binding protein [Geomonas sp. Red32]
MLVITGATGNIGKTATALLLERGERVRVIGRDRTKLQHLVEIGAEAAVGDLNDLPFVTDAFKGAKAVFAMIPPPQFSIASFRNHQREVGETIASALAAAKVGYVVNLSSQGAELSSGTGPVVGLHEQEERLNRLDLNVLHLRPTYFMENLMASIPFIREHGIAGSAVRGDIKLAMIATRDIAEKVAGHLAALDFQGKEVRDLLGERDLTLQEAFGVIGRRIGMPDLKYVQFNPDEAFKGMTMSGFSSDTARLFIEMSKALNEGLFGVNRPRNAANTTPTSIEEFAKSFAAVYQGAVHMHAE